ncbi:MAG: MFS transporter [Streptosporangiales bacterium]|nr:MFS transporter [Streptosporangiales bacterium]
MTDTYSDSVSIAARLNRLPITRVHLLAVGIIGLGLFFDVYEIFLTGTLSAVLREDFQLSSEELALVLASVFLGQFIGAITFGRLADRLGRRRAFMLNLAIYSIFSVVGGLAPNVEVLIAARFIAGLGLGPELALADAYLSDLMPARKRGRFLAWAYTLAFMGVPAAGFLGYWLVPLSPLGLEGWRWLFLLGGLGALLVWVLRQFLPESPRWLESVGRTQEADEIVTKWERLAREAGHELPEPNTAERTVPQRRLPVRSLFVGRYAKRTFMLWVLNALEVFGYYGFGSLAPLVLLSKGYDIVGSLAFLAFVYIGYPLGSALSLPIIERFERKNLIAATAFGMAAFGLLFGFATSAVWIVAWGFAFTVISNVFSNAFHVYLGEIYPTALRATAAGAAYSISRIVTGALPFILIPVLDSQGPGAVFTIVAIALGLLIVDVLVLGPATTGIALEVANPAEDDPPDGEPGAPGAAGQAPESDQRRTP